MAKHSKTPAPDPIEVAPDATTPDPAPDALTPDQDRALAADGIRDPDRVFFRDHQQNERRLREIRLLERGLDTKETHYLTAGDEWRSLSDQDRFAGLDALDTQRAELASERIKAERLVRWGGDRVHGLRVQGAGRKVADLQRTIATAEGEIKKRRDKIGELEGQIRAVQAEIGPFENAIRVALGHAQKAEPSAARVVSLDPFQADPFFPPAGVLVKTSAWHDCVMGLRARGFHGAVDITVDERIGEIVRSPLN